ncbi:TipJ family phage tail tip protein [Oligella urethralis]|uniref:TipJ family phage tail tip protein n=1 Tax=Oligella urethralis TaxID=90245 RepID=UPI00066014F6|nr:phage tail protein [Oligella urethralis]
MNSNNKNLNKVQAIEGYGGKSKSKSRTPREAKDTLFSEEYARIIDLISEGEIKGLVNGLKSIYLDETPLQNKDGSFNFEDVTVSTRLGTQAQEPIKGFPASENEITLNLQVKYGQPVVRTFTNEDLTSLVVRVSTPALMNTNKSNGDINGHSIPFNIELKTDDGLFRVVHSDSFKGKTSAKYSRSIEISLPRNAKSWTVRINRLSKDATTTNIQDKFYVDAITEVIDANLSYPNSALVGIHALAEQFPTVPKRGYEIYGIKVKIPSNYNPYTRVYSGAWDGSFKIDWTDNPAWIFYALATHPLYGLGQRIKEPQLDKWGLYQIARHCDQMVPNGKGGTEPRFTINTYIQNRTQAYELLQNIVSVFRGMVYYAAGSVFAASDRPSIESPYIFSPSNVVDGKFIYEGTPRSNRYSVAVVGWNDPDDMYRQKYEYVEDRKAMLRYGYVPTEFNAFGCTSQGQAQRAGRWALLTSNLETQVVTFTVGLEALKVIPGSICAIQDPSKSNMEKVSGRIASSSRTTVTVDRDLNPSVHVGHKLLVTLPSGVTEERTISNINERTITVGRAFSVPPQQEGQWAIETNIKLPLYRVLSVVDKGDLQYEIRATQHEPSKYVAIESKTRIDPRPTLNWGVHGATPKSPSELDIRASAQGIDGQASIVVGEITWSSDVARHEVRYRVNDGAWVKRFVVGTSLEIPNFKFGTYTIEVTAVNIQGLRSTTSTITKSVTGVEFALSTPTGLRLEGAYTSSWLKVVWNAVRGATSYTVRLSSLGVVRRTVVVGNTLRYDYSAADMKDDGGPWRNVTVEVMANGPFSAKSDWASLAVSNPQIGPLQGIEVLPNTRSIVFNCIKPSESDFAGYLYWISDDPNFKPNESNATKDADFNQIFFELYKGKPLEQKDYYIWAAGYDTFGKDNLNISPSYKAKPLLLKLDPQSITEEMIADGAFTITKFADSIKPPLVVDKLPTDAKENDQAIHASTGKLYRYIGGVWKPVIQEVGDIDSLPADKIDGTLGLNQVPAIPTTKLNGQMQANQIAANAVGANHIAANAIDAGHVKARSLTGDKLVANSVTANELAANSVTVGKIAAGAVGADQISAGAITSEKMTIRGHNLIPNSDFSMGDFTDWSVWAGSVQIVKVKDVVPPSDTRAINSPSQFVAYLVHSAEAKVQATGMFAFSRSYTKSDAKEIPVKAGETYYFSVDLTRGGTGKPESVFYVYVYFFDKDNNNLRGYAAIGGVPITSLPYKWVTREGKVVVPSGAARMSIYFYYYSPASDNTGSALFFTNPRCIRMMDSSLIVDGSIKTQHMTANSIQGDRIAANTLNGDRMIANTLHGNRIQANTITADRLAANTITATSGNIANAAITNAMIANGAITEAKIGNAEITSAKIANAAISSAKIGNLQVDTIKIADHSVTTLLVATSTSFNISIKAPATVLVIASGIERSFSSFVSSISLGGQSSSRNSTSYYGTFIGRERIFHGSYTFTLVVDLSVGNHTLTSNNAGIISVFIRYK